MGRRLAHEEVRGGEGSDEGWVVGGGGNTTKQIPRTLYSIPTLFPWLAGFVLEHPTLPHAP